jgi:ABC-type phosphate/phosphonate transport system substrate-binding protein
MARREKRHAVDTHGSLRAAVVLVLSVRASGGPRNNGDGYHASISRRALQGGEVFAAELAAKKVVSIKVYMPTDYLGVVDLAEPHADMAFVRQDACLRVGKPRRRSWQWMSGTARPVTSRFYVRKDSGLFAGWLRGKTIAFVDPGSTSGYVYPMVTLIKKGLVTNRDPKTFFKDAMFAGTHEAALLALLNGSVDVVASFDLAPQQYLKEKVDRSPTWRNRPHSRGGDVRAEWAGPLAGEKLTESLMAFNAPSIGRFSGLLGSGFAPARDSDYNRSGGD